jgi:hypothetical protein
MVGGVGAFPDCHGKLADEPAEVIEAVELVIGQGAGAIVRGEVRGGDGGGLGMVVVVGLGAEGKEVISEVVAAVLAFHAEAWVVWVGEFAVGEIGEWVGEVFHV